jgi:FkbM family methyltransferase
MRFGVFHVFFILDDIIYYMFVDRFFQSLPVSLRSIYLRAFEASRKREMMKFYSQIIEPGALVFDVGANIGYYTECFLEIGANVIAIEPQPFCIDRLKQRFNDDSNLVIVEKGAARENGTILLNIDSDNPATATFSDKFMNEGPFKNRNWDGKLEVPVITLDEIINEYGVPVYCKIDVEGFELDVLSGLSSPIPYISFEYSKNLLEDAENCIDYLEEFGSPGFNFSISYNPFKLKLGEWTRNKELLFKNIRKSLIGYTGDIFVKFK